MFLEFNSIAEAEQKIKELRELRSRMVGTLYPGIVTDEICQIIDWIKKQRT